MARAFPMMTGPRRGDTKTRKSRRTFDLPQRCVNALRLHRERQDQLRKRTGERWQDKDLVFASRLGTALNSGNVPAHSAP